MTVHTTAETPAIDLELVDIGANLSHTSFHHDLAAVLADAKAVGIAHVIVTGTDLASIETACQLVQQHPDYMTFTAGFHPHVASTFDAYALQQVSRYVRMPEVVAIGETGLDFNRNFSTPRQQENAFIQQLELACEVQKPVFLHQRDAHDTFISLLREYRPRLKSGVVHCFTDNKQALYDYLDQDMYIGITGWVCDERRGQSLQQLVKEIPADRLLLETDSPYLLPRSIKPSPKSRRNEPKYLIEIVQQLSKCTGRSVPSIAKDTTANARALFELPTRVPRTSQGSVPH